MSRRVEALGALSGVGTRDGCGGGSGELADLVGGGEGMESSLERHCWRMRENKVSSIC